MADAAAVDAKGPSKKELSKLAKKNKIAAGPKEDIAKFVVLFTKGASPDMTRAVELFFGNDGFIKYCIDKGEAHLPQLRSVAEGDSLSGSGDANIARFIASSNHALSGSDNPARAVEINTWLDVYSNSLACTSVRDSLVTVVNTHLADKTYCVGAELTLADIAIWTALRKISFVPNFDTAPHASRWFEHVSSLIPWAAIPVSVLAPAAGAAGDAKKAASSSSATTAKGGAGAGGAAAADASAEDDAAGALGGCPPLVGAVEGQVCTRFPPEPSGYLHIGTYVLYTYQLLSCYIALF